LTDNIFSDNDQVPASIPAAEDLVGEGKKFKTVDDLAKGKAESDRFIKQLETELAALRSDLATRQRLETLIDRLETSDSVDQNDSFQSNQNGNQSVSGATAQDNGADIERLIEEKLTTREKETTARQNLAQARELLKQHYGSDFVQKLEDRRVALGIDKDVLDSLAKTSPKAFIEMIAPKRTDSQVYTPPASKVAAFVPQVGHVSGARDWKYYETLRKSNPDAYWSSDVQLQMHKDAINAFNRDEEF
jgi:hypothetical protein